MKRSLLICAAALMMLVSVPQADADILQVTLDLRNTSRGDALSGGTWGLYVRKVEGAGGVNGDFGVAGLRAVISNINATGITFASNINNNISCGGGQCVDTLSNGNIEIVYGQNISAAGVVNTVGIPQAGENANKDTLIASGTWPAGPRPVFALDAGGFGTEGNFLNTNVAPFGNSIAASGVNVATSVYTLGDMNNSGTISNADTTLYRQVLTGAAAYNPAGDINQSGSVTNADTSLYRAILSGPSSASVSVVPEPSSIGLLVIASMGLIARGRRV